MPVETRAVGASWGCLVYTRDAVEGCAAWALGLVVGNTFGAVKSGAIGAFWWFSIHTIASVEGHSICAGRSACTGAFAAVPECVIGAFWRVDMDAGKAVKDAARFALRLVGRETFLSIECVAVRAPGSILVNAVLAVEHK